MDVDDYSELIIKHKIKKSEVDWGILNLRKTDGTKEIFSNLPERFKIVIRSKELANRKIMGTRIWMGYSIMEEFTVNENVEIKRKNNIIYMN